MNLLPLAPHDFEPGAPLAWTLYDEDGHILFTRGETLPVGYPTEGLFRAPEGVAQMVGTPVDEFAAAGPVEEFPVGEMFPPDGIKPQMWEAVQLQMVTRDSQPHYFSRLVGYIRDTSILVTIPRIRKQLVGMVEGEKVEVRMLVGRNIYRFRSDIIKTCLVPSPYMHLSFPDKVQRQHLRKDPWARVDIACTVEVGGQQREATVVNLSATGGRIDATEPLGKEGEVVKLAFPANADGYHHDFSLTARIMKVRQGVAGNRHPPQTEHGVEFLETPEQDAMCLRCLVYQRIAEGFLV
ncbi:MAG: flagellar brake protein [Sulfuricella sp.]|nr:flagellar brake protein [Sulfuricella sp.]